MNFKFMKRAALFLAIVMAVSSFAGCGKGEKTAVEQSGAKVTLNGDKIYPIQCDDTLSMWFYDSASWAFKYENFGETPIGKELAKKTGVNIEYIHPTSGQEMEQFTILLASDDLPDIVDNGWSFFAGGPQAAIDQEYIHRLNDIIKEYSPAFRSYLDNDPEIDKQIKTDKGDYFAYPSISEAGKNKLLVTSGPVIRADWMEELGLEYPTTIDEWDSVLATIKEKKNLESVWLGPLNYVRTAFMPAFGTYPDWYKDGNEIKYGYAQPQYKEFLKKMNEWYKNGILDPDFASADSNTITKKMLNGEAAGCYTWAGSGIGTYMTNNNTEGYDLKAVQYPALKKGEVAEYSALGKRVSMDNRAMAISTNCKNVELAARYLDYGYTEEGQLLYGFGIEGESYNMVEKDGKPYPQYTDLILNNPEGYTIANMLALYARASSGSANFIMREEHIEQYYPLEQQKDAQVQWGKTNMAEHLIPQIYVATEVADEDSDIMTAVRTYVDEMTIAFITGREPIENFDKYIESIKGFGIEKAIKFRQDALERYNKR